MKEFKIQRNDNGMWELSDATICYITQHLFEAGERYKETGFKALASHADELANRLYDGLDAVGYFDDIRNI